MIPRRTTTWTLVGIVIGLSGCDNVTWGGIDVRLEGPPQAEIADPEADPSVPEMPQTVQAPDGPLLLRGERSGNRVTLEALAVLDGDRWTPIPPAEDAPGLTEAIRDDLMPPGTRYTLFSQGVRVGSLVQPGAAETGVGACGPTLEVSGTPELVPSAAGARSFLAVGQGGEGEGRRVPGPREYGRYRAPASTYEQRVGSLNTAGELIPRVGAAWPPSVLESRLDLQILPLGPNDELGIAATFAYQDRLAPGAVPDNAYALFFTALPTSDSTFTPDFVWYRRAGDGGKAVPRLEGHLDLDGDGSHELLLEVFGSQGRWYQLESRRGGTWETLFRSSCAEGSGGS